MREILFRGKTENGIWVKGGFHKHETRQPHCCEELKPEEIKYLIIIDSLADWNMPKNIQCVEVIPETVGMFTGLTDKNGTKIFDGDIVKFIHKHKLRSNDNLIFSLPEPYFEPYSRNYKIEYINTFVSYGLRFINGSIHFPCKQSTLLTHDCEIVGNIYDNPELLEDGEDDD